MDRPIISVALTNLGAYNSGELIFKWLDLPALQEEIDAAFKEIRVSDDPQPNGEIWDEFFITDVGTSLKHLDIGEYTPLDELNDLAADLDGMSDQQLKVIDALLSVGDAPQSAIEIVRRGDFMIYTDCHSWEQLAESIIDKTGSWNNEEVPDGLRYYLDYEKMGRDLQCSGEFIPYGPDNFVMLF